MATRAEQRAQLRGGERAPGDAHLQDALDAHREGTLRHGAALRDNDARAEQGGAQLGVERRQRA